MAASRGPIAAPTALVAALLLAQPQARAGHEVGDAAGWPRVQVVAALPTQIQSVHDIAVDRSGNVVLVGVTSGSSVPEPPGAWGQHCSGGGEAFILRYSTEGALRHASCLDVGPRAARVAAAASPDGSLWVAASFVLSSLAPDSAYVQSPIGLWRFAPTGVGQPELVWVGGPDAPAEVNDLAVAPDGSAWILGSTESPRAAVANAWQPSSGGSMDMLVGRYAPGRREPLMLTYLGGSRWDVGAALAVAADGDVILSGLASSPDFPLQRPVQHHYGGGASDNVIVRFDSSGRWLEYSTFLGGSNDESRCVLATDAEDRLMLAGHSASDDFPPSGPGEPRRWRRDVFFAVLDPAGQLQALSIPESPLGSIPAEDVGGVPVLLAPRQDGLAFVLGTYFSDDLLRGGGFLMLLDESGAAARAPALLEMPTSGHWFVGPAVAGARYVYFVRTLMLPPEGYQRHLCRVPLGGVDWDVTARPGGRDRR